MGPHDMTESAGIILGQFTDPEGHMIGLVKPVVDQGGRS
jgi:hypothetical protein